MSDARPFSVQLASAVVVLHGHRLNTGLRLVGFSHRQYTWRPLHLAVGLGVDLVHVRIREDPQLVGMSIVPLVS